MVDPTANHEGGKSKWVGLALGLAVGTGVLVIGGVSQLTEKRTLNLMPRMELLGLAVGLLPTTAWAGYSICQVIGGPNKPAVLAVVRGSTAVGVFSVLGAISGSILGAKMAGMPSPTGLIDEVLSDLLLVVVGIFLALLVGFALSWPFHLLSKRRNRASAP